MSQLQTRNETWTRAIPAAGVSLRAGLIGVALVVPTVARRFTPGMVLIGSSSARISSQRGNLVYTRPWRVPPRQSGLTSSPASSAGTEPMAAARAFSSRPEVGPAVES